MYRNMADGHFAFMDKWSTDDSEITLDGFVTELIRVENADLLTSVGVRKFVLMYGGVARRRPKSNFLKTYTPQM